MEYRNYRVRRSPRVNGDNGRQEIEIVMARRIWGRAIVSGVEQFGKDKPETAAEIQLHSRENRSRKDGQGTIDKSRVESQAKKKLRIGPWNVSGVAAEERNRLEIAEQASSRDLRRYSGNSRVMGERGGGE